MAAADLHMLVPATAGHFETSLLVLGAVLAAGALVSGLARRSFLSLTALFVVVGFLLGDGAIGVLHFNARDSFVTDLATVALVVILFRDGLEVDAEALQQHWHLPLRKLVLAMPLTALIVAVAAKLFTDLTWTECFLIGALLSPTDPVLSAAVVTDARVPRLIRHSLNLESGLNDGLALPVVLALAATLAPASNHVVWWQFLLEDLTIGVGVGLLVGYVAARLMPSGEGVDIGIPDHQKSLYSLGVAFGAYGVAVLIPQGNGLIAVYVAAITLGIRRPDLGHYFARQSADLVELVKLGVFLVFGSLLTVHGLFGDGWAAVGIVVVTLLVARPTAVFAALIGTGTSTAAKGFMAWFGPKGVATMTYSVLVLGEGIASGERIFDIAALTVFCSIIVHGLTDTAGVEWIARRSQEQRTPSILR